MFAATLLRVTRRRQRTYRLLLAQIAIALGLRATETVYGDRNLRAGLDDAISGLSGPYQQTTEFPAELGYGTRSELGP